MKQLIRTRKKTIAGVCGGLGVYFNIDPLIFKLIFFGLIFTPAPIILIYLCAWVLIPKEPKY